MIAGFSLNPLCLPRTSCYHRAVNGRGRESYDRRFYAKRGWIERPELADFVLKLR